MNFNDYTVYGVVPYLFGQSLTSVLGYMPQCLSVKYEAFATNITKISLNFTVFQEMRFIVSLVS